MIERNFNNIVDDFNLKYNPTIFQIRAARGGLGISIEKLSQSIDVNSSTLARIEKIKNPLEKPNCHFKTMRELYFFFVENSVFFEKGNAVSIKRAKYNVEFEGFFQEVIHQKAGLLLHPEKISAFQLRAAREGLGFKAIDFAPMVELTPTRICSLENAENILFPLQCTKNNMQKIIKFFNDRGVYFDSDNRVFLKDQSPQEKTVSSTSNLKFG